MSSFMGPICRLAARSQASKLTFSKPVNRASVLRMYEQRRFIDLQEYQSKQILRENGVQVQRFKVAANEDDVNQILFPELYNDNKRAQNNQQDEDDISNSSEFVIKAQVLAGGRGKGSFVNSQLQGGVQLTQARDQAAKFANTMLNDRLVTKQTGKNGVLVERVMIAEAVNIKKEFYFAIVLDRSYDSGPIMVTSPYGGMDIEEVAAKSDEAIRKFTIPLDTPLKLETARQMALVAFDLNLIDIDLIDQCANQMIKLHQLFLKLDASQIEINPLGITDKRQVICVDAKINFDENARYRQRWIDEIEKNNQSETDTRDAEARKHGLNFIALDGSIGCLVNGAGLAMATMDIIKLHGGEPANFLDVGGGATVEQVTAAFKIIKADPSVRAIFVNIFGGIMRCDTVAQAIVNATQNLGITMPIVVRLEGTRVQEARELIKSSQPNIISCDDFEMAAQTVVKMTC